MKRLYVAIILLTFFATSSFAYIKPINNGPVVDKDNIIVYLMSAKTSTGLSDVFTIHPEHRTFHAKVVGTGAVTATVIVQVSNDGTTWIDATVSPHIDLSGTTSDADGFTMLAKWGYVRVNLSAISGTGAAVTVTLGV
jgi:hypothetical protein